MDKRSGRKRAAPDYRPARRGDCGEILELIRELAAYEKLSHEVTASRQALSESLFGPDPKAFCYLAVLEGYIAGFALCFYNYSTFLARPGIYIEDLYVRPEYRGRGIGKGFFRVLADKALKENCGRLEWWVLGWNAPAIEFYKALGARPMDDWTVYRMDESAIRALARSGCEIRGDINRAASKNYGHLSLRIEHRSKPSLRALPALPKHSKGRGVQSICLFRPQVDRKVDYMDALYARRVMTTALNCSIIHYNALPRVSFLSLPKQPAAEIFSCIRHYKYAILNLHAYT